MLDAEGRRCWRSVSEGIAAPDVCRQPTGPVAQRRRAARRTALEGAGPFSHRSGMVHPYSYAGLFRELNPGPLAP